METGEQQTRGLYGRILLAWIVGLLILPGAVAVLLGWAADARCDAGATDCSWGLEVLLILPALAFSLVTIGPLAVYVLLRRLGDPLAGSTARWALVLVPAAVPAAVIVRGLALLLPPLGGRYLALRRSRRTVLAARE